MTKMQHLVRVLIVVASVTILGTGCQTYKSQAKSMTTAWTGGNAPQAAAEFGQQADKCDKSDMVIWHLEAGSAYRPGGDFTNSNKHLDLAAAQIDVFDTQAKTKVGLETMAIMTDQQNLPYLGRSYDKIMLYTYKALNYLAVGEIEKARPEIIHAYQCQQDAVEENKRRIEKSQEAEQKSEQRDRIAKAKADPKYAEALDSGTKDLQDFKFYADYVNPFTVYLDGLYFLYAGAGGSDLERARKSLSRVQEIVGSNKFIDADLQLAEGAANGQPLSPCTYVIFETGQAASRDQVAINIPIVVLKVSYVGTAFPKLAFHNNHATELTVKAGELEEKTVTIANMDSIVALDFKNEWPTILTKTIISTTAKAAANYAINDAAQRAGGTLGGLLSKLGTLGAEAAMNIADTRTWTTLPKEFQVARISTPTDRKLVLSTPDARPYGSCDHGWNYQRGLCQINKCQQPVAGQPIYTQMKYASLLFVSIAFLGASLLQYGCSTVNTVEPAEPAAQRQMLNDKRVITDTGLYGRVRVVGINTSTVSTGFLKIQVEVQNLSSSLQSFAYRVEWIDASGMALSTPASAWIDRQIQGGETLSLTGIAPTETAKDFRIKFIAR